MLFAILLIFPFVSHQFDFSLDAYGKECFSEYIEDDGTFLIKYEVVDGGFLEVDLLIYGPNNQLVYNVDRKPSGSYRTHAVKGGNFEVCFTNTHSSIANKIIVFYLTVEPKNKEKEVSDKKESEQSKKTQRLEGHMYSLATKVMELRRGQEFMDMRDETHTRLAKRSNLYVVMWAVSECVTFLIVTCAQIYYLTKFFEVRRVI